MRRVVATLALILLAVVPFAFADDDIIPNEYLVTIREDASLTEFTSFVRILKGIFSLAADEENYVISDFKIGTTFKVIHVRASPQMIEKLGNDPLVVAVEPNRRVSLSQCETEKDAIWNLARVSERKLNPANTDYKYDNVADNVDAYVIDTGVLIGHVEFEGRASWGYNAADHENRDCNGHGTHVAGTIAGKLYGVAKKAKVIAVKVLNCEGSGTIAGVIDGIQWVASNHKSTRRSVANMSLGGGKSTTLNSAVDAAVTSGITFAVAAGNDDRDACNYSPASATSAITVAATNNKDVRSYFSNYGSCVDIYAPGESIKSAWINIAGQPVNGSYKIISGTSMASPHVAGVSALFLSRTDGTPKQIKDRVLGDSTPDVINMDCVNTACNQTPNKFLFSGACN